MSTETLTDGPTQDEMIGLIRERWPDAVTAEIEGAINPSHVTVREGLMPLIGAAHDRLVAGRERQRRGER